MLTKLRRFLDTYTRKIGYAVAHIIPSPNIITILGLLFAIIFLSLILISTNYTYVIAIIFYILSISMDVLDGAVAKATGKSSKIGAFLDSTIDRITDAIYVLALYYILELDPIIIFLLLFGCLMISYIRAKAESMGLKMEGIGIAERGDRLILILIILFTYVFSKLSALILTIVLLELILVTIIQRIYYTLSKGYIFEKDTKL